MRDKIKNRITLLGLKKSHVAKRIGMTPSNFSHYLNGKIEIPFDRETILRKYLSL
jgi:transcriptional regulator with XRE-family HTH domain